MHNWQSRTELLLGKKKHQKLINTHVLIVGLGGVGAYAAEQLCRAGIGKLTLIDADIVHETNLNRQIIALTTTIGQNKTEVVENRLKKINPQIVIDTHTSFLDKNNISEMVPQSADYVIDAIDTLMPKVELLYYCKTNNIPVISSMGSGGKTDPSKIQVADIDNSYNCRLAFFVRKRLHQRNIFTGIEVVFSTEQTPKKTLQIIDEQNKKTTAGTISFIPAIFGCYCAAYIINKITQQNAK